MQITQLINNISSFLRAFAANFRDTAIDVLALPYIKLLTALNLLLNALLWLSTYAINTLVSQELIVLHYNVDFGVNLIGSSHSLYMIPALGLYIVTVNFFLCVFIKTDRRLFAYLLNAAALSAGSFLLLALGSLYLINFR